MRRLSRNRQRVPIKFNKFYGYRRLMMTVAAVVLASLAVLAERTFAQGVGVADTIGNWLAQLAFWLIQMLANLLVVVINIMVAVAQYNNFLNSPAVTRGWVIVRDISNMFFIVVLLIISFGTILRLENYRYNRLLARLIVMAVLVNFSKFIAGFFIDFAQVIMLTFVNAWRDAAAGNITSALGLKDIISISGAGGDVASANVGGILTAMLLGIFLLAVAVIVMFIIAIVLILRVFALWFLVVLSPLAYVLRTYPGTEKYASRWWSEFGKYVTTGPVLAFMLWLALAIMSSPTPFAEDVFTKVKTTEREGVVQPVGSESGTAAAISAALTDIGRSDKLLSYITGIMLLVGALVMTKELGVAGGQMAGQWAERIKGFGTKAATVGGVAAVAGPLGVAALAGRRRALQLATQVKRLPGAVGGLADEALIRAQRAGLLGPGLKERPVSLRPSVLKAAYQEHRRRKKEDIYYGIMGDAADRMNRMLTGRESNYGERERTAYSHKMEAELSQGGQRYERIIPELKSFIEFKKDNTGRVVGARIAPGREAHFAAALRILAKNRDLNEALAKTPEFRDIVELTRDDADRASDRTGARLYGAENVSRILRFLLGPKQGAHLGNELGELGRTSNDTFLSTVTETSPRTGELELLNNFSMSERLTGRHFNELRRFSRAEHGGQTWEEWRDAEGRTEEEKLEYRDYIENQTDEMRANITAALDAKKVARISAERWVKSTVLPEIGIGPNDAFRLAELSEAGQRTIRDDSGAINNPERFKIDVRRELLANLDVILAYAHSASTDPRKRGLYKALTGKGVSAPVSPEQQRAIYKFVAVLLGAQSSFRTNAQSYDTESLGNQMEGIVSQYLGNFPLYRKAKQRVILRRAPELDRTDIDQYKAQQAEIDQAAKREAGLVDVPITKLGLPVEGQYRLLPPEQPTGQPRQARAPEQPPQLIIPPSAQFEIERGEEPPPGGPGGAPAPTQPTPEGGEPDGAALRDITPEKIKTYEDMRPTVDQYEQQYGAGSFFRSPEFQRNAAKYVSEEEYNVMRALEKQEAADVAGIAAFGSGESNVIGIDARQFAGGKFAGRAGHFLNNPNDIRDFATEYGTLIDRQTSEIEAKVEKTAYDQARLEHLRRARQRLNDPEAIKNLLVVNTARAGYSPRHVVAHEGTHEKLQQLGGSTFLNELRSGMSTEQFKPIADSMRAKMGEQMSDDEAFEEYVTEGMVNQKKFWADTAADAVRLDPAILEKVLDRARQRNVRFATSAPDEFEDMTRTPGALSGYLRAMGYKGGQMTQGVLRSALRGAGQLFQGGARRAAELGRGLAAASPVVAAAGQAAQAVGRGTVTAARSVAAVPGQIRAGAQVMAGRVQQAREERRDRRFEQASGQARSAEQDYQQKRSERVRLENVERQVRAKQVADDARLAEQITILRQQRESEIRAGNVGRVAALNQEIDLLDKQRQGARNIVEDTAAKRLDAEREEEAAAIKAGRSIGRAEGRRPAGAPPAPAAAAPAPSPAAPTPAPTPSPAAAAARAPAEVAAAPAQAPPATAAVRPPEAQVFDPEAAARQFENMIRLSGEELQRSIAAASNQLDQTINRMEQSAAKQDQDRAREVRKRMNELTSGTAERRGSVIPGDEFEIKRLLRELANHVQKQARAAGETPPVINRNVIER